MKYFLLLLIGIVLFSCTGQQSSFSPEVKKSMGTSSQKSIYQVTSSEVESVEKQIDLTAEEKEALKLISE